MKKALITGITGQDGAYLAKLLLEKGYEVWGAYRSSSSLNFWRLEELGVRDDVRLIPLDLLEYSNIVRALEKVQPDEIYNLAAQSFVALSFEMPLYTAEADALGVTRLLEALRAVKPGCSLLSGLHLGDVWKSAGNSPDRTDPLLSPFSLRGCQTIRPLDNGQLPRVLWHTCLLRDPLQP